MAHESRFKFKHGGKMMTADKMAELREAERQRKKPDLPHINLDFLPSVEELERLEEDEVPEYFFICRHMVPIVAEGVEVGKKECGHRFASEDIDACCPHCYGEELQNIPRAFLKLVGTNRDVACYVTAEMQVRKGLPGVKYVELAKQIIAKYGRSGQKVSVSRKIGEM